MSIETETQPRGSRVIVVGNEKGGSGKSTVAMHIAVALMKFGERVGTIDLDSRQQTFSRYVENRREWANLVGRDLEIPNHVCVEADDSLAVFVSTLDTLAQTCSYIVIDTPGHDNQLMRLAHSMADTLITPLNDSFVDFDVLGNVDPETFAVTGISHYARMVEETRRQRQAVNNADTDWIVLRNRLSSLGSRNKRLVGEGLQELSRRLDFRALDGFAERVIFREFYPRGLTALDDLDGATLGTRPTMSHITARLEIESLLTALMLGKIATSNEADVGNRNAA
jgi:chromosome partitioning protein